MNRPLLSALLVGALLLAAAVPAAAQGGRPEREEREKEERGGGSGNAAPPPTPAEQENRGQGRGRSDDERRGQGPPTPTPPTGPPSGQFQVQEDGRSAQGRYVSFSVNDTGVENFTAEGTPLFDLTVEGEEDDKRRRDVERHGASVEVHGPTFRFKAHDNPSAVAKVETDGLVSLLFEPGVVLGEPTGERIEFTLGNLTGTVRAKALQVDNGTVVARGDLMVVLHKPQGTFDLYREDIGRAIGKGHVGAEAILVRADADDLLEDVISYGNVTMTTLRAEKGNLTVAVEGHGTEGRVVVLNVDASILGAKSKEDLTVVLDNLTIAHATDLVDVLDPENDGFLPEYYIVFDPQTESFQLLLSVPHYSVHILSVITAIPLPPPSVVFGIVAGVALLAPGAYVLFRRREDA